MVDTYYLDCMRQAAYERLEIRARDCVFGFDRTQTRDVRSGPFAGRLPRFPIIPLIAGNYFTLA